jgi:N-acetylmuramoyl-L-alanine amidase
VPLSERVPVHVRETDAGLAVRLYGAVSDVNWIRYGAADSLVARATWWQAAADEVELDVALTRPVWGWRTRWERGDLLVEIRRPPAIDAGDPLRGRLIVVDPGHPPGGATGPTGLREAEANLGVALRLRELLEEAGARVVMTRVTDTAVDLLPRTRFAERLDPELLVSIHNNALPDGVNPLVNNGTSVYFNHPQSIDLARAVQAALVRRLGLRDLGVGRGDLALVRPTWMPAILTEGLFMMIPAQEAALRGEEGRELYARGVFEGLRGFLAARARGRP